MYKLPIKLTFRKFVLTSEDDDQPLSERDVKDYAFKIEQYIYNLFASLDLPEVFILSKIKTSCVRIPEDSGIYYATYCLEYAMSISILAENFATVHTYYLALDGLCSLIERKHDLRVTLFDEREKLLNTKD